MSRLIIEQVRGGFIITDDSGPYVACHPHIVMSIIEAWANGLPWSPPTSPAPDAAPAPFRVGDRVVFRDASRKLLNETGPWLIAETKPHRVRLEVPDDRRDWWVGPSELRHAPVEDL